MKASYNPTGCLSRCDFHALLTHLEALNRLQMTDTDNSQHYSSRRCTATLSLVDSYNYLVTANITLAHELDKANAALASADKTKG